MMNLLFTNVARAYELVYKFPGLPETVSGPSEYIQLIYKFGLGLVGLFGFGALVWGGIQYIISGDNIAKRMDARGQIRDALLGILLLAGSVLLLNEINPQILRTSLEMLEEVQNKPEPPLSPLDAALHAAREGRTTGAPPSGDALKNGFNTAKASGGESLAATYFVMLSPEEQSALLQSLDENSRADYVKTLIRNTPLNAGSTAAKSIENALSGAERQRIWLELYSNTSNIDQKDFVRSFSLSAARQFYDQVGTGASGAFNQTTLAVQLSANQAVALYADDERSNRFLRELTSSSNSIGASASQIIDMWRRLGEVGLNRESFARQIKLTAADFPDGSHAASALKNAVAERLPANERSAWEAQFGTVTERMNF